ncbi:MAG TPA: SlyX family protein [Tichowtungia sp.]|nr:SlyX family protein [Tichowtungia sp.]
MEKRLTQLEELFSNQTHTIDQMSLEMFQQQKEIAALKQQIEELTEKLESTGNEIGENERPPHY